MKEFEIDKRPVGGENSVFIIAEISANHNGKYETALETIRSIKKSGADAVKVQTYTPDTITINCRNEHFMINHGTIWDGESLYDLYKKAYTPWDWQPRLKEAAENEGLIFFSSPFDPSAVDFLEEMNVPCYKIASFEITDIPLIRYVAKKNKPILLSTGIANLSDIELAIRTLKEEGNENYALLKCTSQYPAPLDGVNLLNMVSLRDIFGAVVGISDHTLGISVAGAASALGAKIIEKHFILDRRLGGSDASFSMEPQEFLHMVKSVREIEKALGTTKYSISNEIKRIKAKGMRSLFAVRDIKKGELLTEANVRSIRPGFGLHPRFYSHVLGMKARRDITFGTPLGWNLLE